MRAVVLDSFGSPLVVQNMPTPTIGHGRIRVRQAYSTLSGGDALMAAGRPWLFRPVFRAMLRPAILGRDVAGVVTEVGPGVSGVQVGDRVVGEAGQAWAEEVVIATGAAALVPESVSLRQASTLAVSGVTALQGLRAAGVRSGSRVLVVGASGGVGHLAVQIASAWGAAVTGVCSGAKAARVREAGAERVVDYRSERFVDLDLAYDAILDLSGRTPLSACIGRLAQGGVYVCAAGSNGGALLGPLPRMLHCGLRSIVDGRVKVLGASVQPDDLSTLLDMVGRGEVEPWIGGEVGPSGVWDALGQLVAGAGIGKTVVKWTGG